MKRALLLNAVNPRISGALIRGNKGTAKSTAVRALAAVLSPLWAGIDRARELVIAEQAQNAGVIPLLVLVSDGRANVPRGSLGPAESTSEAAGGRTGRRLRRARSARRQVAGRCRESRGPHRPRLKPTAPSRVTAFLSRPADHVAPFAVRQSLPTPWLH